MAVLATGVAVEASLHRFVQGQVDQRLDGEVMALAAAFEPGSDGRLVLSRPVEGPPFDDPRSGWIWMARSGPDTWTSGSLQATDLRLPQLPGVLGRHPTTIEGEGPGGRALRARSLAVRIDGQPLTVVAAAPREAETGPLRDALVPVVVALLLLGCGLLAATMIQVRLGLAPLDRLRADLAAVRAGRM
ncbi:MAG: sensor histidine kinase, partial [Caulobacteraceae bacterium]|nr:sensor histidine kinase [Caulobacter sp.]